MKGNVWDSEFSAGYGVLIVGCWYCSYMALGSSNHVRHCNFGYHEFVSMTSIIHYALETTIQACQSNLVAIIVAAIRDQRSSTCYLLCYLYATTALRLLRVIFQCCECAS